MKKIALALAVVVFLVVGATQASARPTQRGAVTKVTVVMHDPGCHWFSVAGHLETRLTVGGPVALVNLDEAALKIVGAGAVRHAGIGKTILLPKGAYAITMVGQATDDNHLKLVVR